MVTRPLASERGHTQESAEHPNFPPTQAIGPGCETVSVPMVWTVLRAPARTFRVGHAIGKKLNPHTKCPLDEVILMLVNKSSPVPFIDRGLEVVF